MLSLKDVILFQEKIINKTGGKHGFIDGNKRIGVAVMILLLKLNKISLSYTQEELIVLGLSLADGSYKYEDVVIWITKHVVD